MVRLRCRHPIGLVVLLALASAPRAQAQPLSVAAAADLQAVLPLVVGPFERETGQTVRITFGSSGNFYAQIQNGAPFDVFLSADLDYPTRLVEAGLAARETLREYAAGRLVLWSRRDRGLDLTRGLEALADAHVRRVSIANPAHAPYGRAAVEALRRAGLYERVSGKLVMGENVSQAAQFAQSGNADAGLFALSIALTPAVQAVGAHVDIPSALYAPIRQGGVVINASRQRPLAERFLGRLVQPDAARLLARFGFALPPAVPPAPSSPR